MDYLKHVPAIAMATVPRSPNYALETLRSATSQDPEFVAACPSFLVSVGRPDASYLDAFDFGQIPNARVLPSSSPLHAPANIHRCLTQGAVPGRPLILLEDDMSFCPGWLRILTVLWLEHFQPYFSRYGIAGYSPYIESSKKPFAKYSGNFYASCCMLMSEASLAPLAEYLRQKSIIEQDPSVRMPADVALGHWFQSGGGELYQTTPSLAEHEGLKGTLGDSRERKAGAFGVPDLSKI